VTFNDHDGSTKSYSWVKDHDEQIQDVTFIPFFEEIHVDYEPGTMKEVELHDGSHLVLKKLAEDHDPTDRIGAMRLIEEARERNQLLTGLLHIDEGAQDFATREHLPSRPLRDYDEAELRIGRDDFVQHMSELA
jgi:2-oxoglutarate ferredoxin oxidoreductase subunit beta